MRIIQDRRYLFKPALTQSFSIEMGYDYVSFAYAFLVAVGGVIGYVKKGSVASGLMGVLAGALMGVGAWQTSNNPSNYQLSLAVAGGLLALMGYRWMRT